jgi:hypothetical protein
MNSKVDIYYFNLDGETKKKKECLLLKNFLYKRINFFLTTKEKTYDICVNDEKDELRSIWSRCVTENGVKKTESMIMSEFRKNFDKNEITIDLINKYLKKPLKYTKIKRKKETKK